jgi:hypothetical protein
VLCCTQVINAEGEGGLGVSARPWRRSGNLSALKVEVWSAIRAASLVIGDAGTEPELKLKAASTITTAGAVYLRILEGSEMQERIDALERLVHRRNGHGKPAL